MPTYQYACPDCGAEFEKVQKFTDKPLKKCPKCGKAKVHRVVSRVAVSFKGSGFYVNDSKSSSSTSSTSNASSASTKPEKTEAAASATEAKAEPAAESKTSDATSSAKAESKPAEAKKSRKKDGD